MCGICGIVTRGKLPDGDLVGALMARMAHRGPDGDGRFADRHVRLGMRRLAIIAPASGQQPIFNADRSVAVIANGEIYNYIELRGAMGDLAGARALAEEALQVIGAATERARAEGREPEAWVGVIQAGVLIRCGRR